MANLDLTYTAKRGLVAGHAENSVQTLNLDLSRLIPSDKVEATQRIKGNKASSNLESVTTYYDVTTQMLDESEMLVVREFLLSCSNSETFSFVLLGAPSQIATLELKSEVKPNQVSPLKYRFSFKFFVSS